MNSTIRVGTTKVAILLATAVLAACDSSETLATQVSPPALKRVALAAVPSLGAAKSFAVFGGGAGVVNQGTWTVINGDLGTTGASTTLTGFHSPSAIYIETPLNVGKVNGLVITDAPQGTQVDFLLAKSVAADALLAATLLAAIPDGIDPGAGLLGGLTLAPGVYKSASGSFELINSDLTLDGQGDTNSVWVFQMASSLTVGAPGAPRTVILKNGARSRNIYWQVGSDAVINSAGGGTMAGTIIASAGVVISTSGNAAITTLNGRALGLFASVTMVNTVVNSPASPASPADPVLPPIDTNRVHVVVSGTAAADVALVPGDGSLDILNNGGHVAANQSGTGTIHIVNNGSLVTAANTGNGMITISNSGTGSVTVTNTGKGSVTVTASGAIPLVITHSGDEDYSWPVSVGIRKR